MRPIPISQALSRPEERPSKTSVVCGAPFVVGTARPFRRSPTNLRRGRRPQDCPPAAPVQCRYKDTGEAFGPDRGGRTHRELHATLQCCLLCSFSPCRTCSGMTVQPSSSSPPFQGSPAEGWLTHSQTGLQGCPSSTSLAPSLGPAPDPAFSRLSVIFPKRDISAQHHVLFHHSRDLWLFLLSAESAPASSRPCR